MKELAFYRGGQRMRGMWFILLVSLVEFCCWKSSTAQAKVRTLKGRPLYVPGEILISLKPEASVISKTHALSLAGRSEPVLASSVLRIHLIVGQSVEEAVQRMRQEAAVLVAQPNYYHYALAVNWTPPTEFTNYASALGDYGWPFEQVKAPAAWAYLQGQNPQPGTPVTVAVLDSGVATNHPDLPPSLFVPGYNYAYGNSNTNDDYGHGTFVAGVLAGLWNNAAVTAEACQSAASIAMNQCGPGTPATIFCNEGITLTGAVVGMAGAPGLVALMPVKILDNTGSCTTAQEVSGINYAVSHGARILNLSLGGPTDPTEESAIESAISSGCIVVAAAGNEADLYGDFGAPVTVNLDYPAGYPGVLAVGATDATTQVADYSNGGTGTGGQLLSLVAPGGGNVCGNINVSGQNAGYDPVNDFFGALLCPQANADFDTSVNASGVCDPNYGTVSGTSFSSALVSGAAALVWALYPAISNTQVAQQLMDNTDPLTVGGAPQTGWNTLSGYGLLDLDKALVNTPPPTPTFTPTSTVTPTNTITLTPTVTATLAITPTPGPSFSAYAKPNITDGQGPIQFVVSLPSALKVNLSVYNVAGEMVYAGYFPKPEGTSTILWALQNQSGSNLASGLYLYYIQAKSDSQVFQKMGKIALIR